MNLRKTILAEHSKSQANKIINWVGQDKKRFAELVNILIIGEYRLSQLSSWPVADIAIAYPELAKPYLTKFIKLLLRKDTHPAVQRHMLKLFQFIEVPKKHQGEVVNACFGFLIKSQYPIAIKAFSMTVLLKITHKEPELKRELKIVIEEQMKEASGGILARGRMVLKELNSIK